MKYHENFSLENIIYTGPDGLKHVELWKDVPEFELFYQISNLGRFKSLARVIYKRPQPDRILKQCPNRNGYFQVLLYKDGRKKNYRINRLVGLLFIPNPENKPEVNHIKNELGDVDKTDNRYFMLEWNTGEENRNNAMKDGLIRKGEQLHNSKLTELQILEIRINKDNLSHRKLAIAYNVSKTNITSIINYKIWKHLP